MRYLQVWASTVLGAVLATEILQATLPGISQWWQVPAGMAGALLGSEVMRYSITGRIGGRLAQRNSHDN